MGQTIALVIASVFFAQGHSDLINVTAEITSETLEPKKNHDLVIQVEIDSAWQGGQGLIAKPIVQIDAPNSIRLRGKSPKTLRDLAKNEFLRAPNEILVENGSATIPFWLKETPTAGDAIRFNVLAYVTSDAGNDTRFIRRRFEVPLQPAAKAREIDASPSSWGNPDWNILQLNDAAPDFEIPTSSGGSISPGIYKSKKNVVVMTYRAFW